MAITLTQRHDLSFQYGSHHSAVFGYIFHLYGFCICSRFWLRTHAHPDSPPAHDLQNGSIHADHLSDPQTHPDPRITDSDTLHRSQTEISTPTPNTAYDLGIIFKNCVITRDDTSALFDLNPLASALRVSGANGSSGTGEHRQSRSHPRSWWHVHTQTGVG